MPVTHPRCFSSSRVWVMVNQHEDAVFRAKQSVEAGLGGHDYSLGYEGGRSGSGGVDKDVEGSDSAAFNPGDMGFRHGRGTVRWTGLPAQPPKTVVANGRTDRGEDKVWRQARQERFHRLADGGMARRRRIRFIQYRI